MENIKELSPEQQDIIIEILKTRFEKNRDRHKALEWSNVEAKLKANVDKLWSLNQMEQTSGEPDVIEYSATTNEYLFVDCATETPKGRRSICYDREALDSRKEHKPENTAIDMATQMGIEILTEEQYRKLQQVGSYDTKTSSWIKTPEAIRKLGGALFGDRRYNHTFIYHNGADSYYAVRGFRGMLSV